MFSTGPFSFQPGAVRTVNGIKTKQWEMHYGVTFLAALTLPESATQAEIADAFDGTRAQFIDDAQRQFAPDLLRLTDADGETLATIRVSSWPTGMSIGIPDDRFPSWLCTETKPTSCMPVSLDEFAQIAARRAAPPRAWIAGLLPDDVLTTTAEDWQAPTAHEIRHIVGEGSLTGVTGAAAAALVGVTPQNFRKYLAADDATTRQKISFAMWHLLLAQLGVQGVQA
jgi:hypothetical protein